MNSQSVKLEDGCSGEKSVTGGTYKLPVLTE